jgi:hypothetical protein
MVTWSGLNRNKMRADPGRHAQGMSDQEPDPQVSPRRRLALYAFLLALAALVG